jgi:hypothetical protein
MDLVRAASISALVLLIPFNAHTAIFISRHSPHLSGGYPQNTYLTVVDVVFAFLIVCALPLVVRNVRVLMAPAIVAPAALGLLALARVAADPSDQGLAMAVRLVGVAAVAIVMATMPWRTFTTAVVWPLAIGAAIQGSLAIMMTLTGTGKVRPDELATAGVPWTAGLGSFGHEYVLAAFMALTISVVLVQAAKQQMHPFLWMSVVIASASIATTFGRAAALSIILIGGTYGVASIVSRRRDLGLAGLATLVPLGTAMLVTASGWIARASASSSIRVALAQRSFDVIATSPLLGVGPGRYGVTLAQIGLTSVDVYIVHNLPLLVTAEFGIPVGIAFSAWLIALGFVSIRAGVAATAMFLGILPLIFFDNLHYVIPDGTPILAVWCGSLTMLVGTTWRPGRGGSAV